MKIALIVPGFSSSERDWCIPALLDYVRVLARQAEVHVFPLRWPETRRTYTVHGATVHPMGGRKRLGVRAIALWRRTIAAIASEHRRSPFGLIHAFWADEPGWIGAWAGRRLRIPVVISVAGGELVGMADIGYGLLLHRGRGPLVRWALRRATSVTAGSLYLTELVRRHLPQSHWKKLRRGPLGVDTELFTPAAEPPTESIVVSVGGLYPVKNQAAILRAFADTAGSLLRIAGNGPLLRSLEQLAADLGVARRVQFLGEIDHATMPRLYRSATVFVQASRHEAQGMAALEAAACGVPVMGTPVGLLPEIGVASAGEADLAWLLRELLADGARREIVRDAALETVRRDFSLESALERMMDVYLQAIGDPTRGLF
jgi:glycosyltransferase involved in cell wall biosynthesis